MTDLAETYPRFGYRRINVCMERLGHVMGVDKAFPVMVLGRIAGTQKAATETGHNIPFTTATSDGSKRTVGVRLYVYDACANGQQI